jgi:hypothetical protein
MEAPNFIGIAPKKIKKLLFLARASFIVTSAGLLTLANPANAADFSFKGSFNSDDDVQLFNFTVDSTSEVTLKTLSYAGGTQADGTIVSDGGFDPILSLFDSSGDLIDRNDDGNFDEVPADPTTGQYYDTFLQSLLDPGTYTVAVSQYNNFPVGSNLSQGFIRQGQPNFTSDYGCSTGRFCDINRNSRTNSWAFDILNVDRASTPPTIIPEPATVLGTLAFGILGGSFWKKRKSQKNA